MSGATILQTNANVESFDLRVSFFLLSEQFDFSFLVDIIL